MRRRPREAANTKRQSLLEHKQTTICPAHGTDHIQDLGEDTNRKKKRQKRREERGCNTLCATKESMEMNND